MTNSTLLHALRSLSTLSAITLISACAAGAQTAAIDRDPVNRPLNASVCALDAYAPANVQPHYDNEIVLKTTLRKLHGADVFVPARPGLTAEWLRHDLRPRPGDGCALGVAGAEVSVASAGAGFLVAIRANSEDAGSEILRLARATEPQQIAGAGR